ncbi:hypothetical protein M2372_000102 [Chryseobacterium sp. BIGb0232]|nr:hypothetical protein [Chryseobacterium sp. BIGb0232]
MGISLEEKIKKNFNLENSFDQVIINEYKPGQGISNHIDCVPCFEDVIISVSLLSSCIMQFSKDREQQEILIMTPKSFTVKRRGKISLETCIKAVKNDKWSDTIIPRKRRISITFRKTKE